MEQKRTLWIIAAVGVFLLVVLGAALMLYAPAARPAQSVASRGNDKATASNGWISLAPSAPEQGRPYDFRGGNPPDGQPMDFDPQAPRPDAPGSEFRTDEVNVYAETANVYSEKTDMNGLGNASVTGSTQPQTVINNTTTIDLNSTPASAVVTQNGKTAASKSAEPVPPAAVASAKPAKQEKAVAKAAPVKETSVQKAAVKPAGVKQSTSVAAKAPAKPASVSKTSKTVSAKPAITQYWIQVTALTSRKSADAAREVLGENQITADVFTYTDARNQLFYRVRVGPYTTKSEAEYWRTKIAKIDNFAGTASYVTAAQVE